METENENSPKFILKSLTRRSAKNRLINFKVTAWEYEEISRRADKYADGNLSAYVREACMLYSPKKSDIVELNGKK